MNQKYIQIFDYLFSNLNTNELYSIGGTSRDLLLNKEIEDFDFCSNLIPSQVKLVFKDGNYTFERFGGVELSYLNNRITLTTFREDLVYEDNRHPKVNFIDSYVKDSFRRDFSINAIYINHYGNIFDPQNGVKDLNENTIRMIGDISKRINEDPLRILRAYRFKSQLNFKIEKELEKYIDSNFNLLSKISKGKIIQELNKCDYNMKMYLFTRLVDDKIIDEGYKNELKL